MTPPPCPPDLDETMCFKIVLAVEVQWTMSKSHVPRMQWRERRRRAACYVTPLSVLCLSQCGDVSFLTAMVSNLASLMFLAPERQPKRDLVPEQIHIYIDCLSFIVFGCGLVDTSCSLFLLHFLSPEK